MPDWRAFVRNKLRLIGASPERESDIVDEVARQLEDAYNDALRRGLDSDAAIRAAREHITDWDAFSADLRKTAQRRRGNRFQGFRGEVIYSMRSFRGNPGFTVIVLITLILGIGANTAAFTLVNTVLFQPLPYAEPERLVRIWEDPGSNPRNFLNPRNTADWRERNRSFEQSAAFGIDSVNLTGDGEAERLVAASCSPELFSILGVQPLIGRTFTSGEDSPSAAPVTLISERLWKRRFGSTARIIGETITLNGQKAVVLGVLPSEFQFLPQVDVWRPAVFTPEMLDPTQRGSHYLRAIARLKRDVTVLQAQEDLDSIYADLREQFPNALKKWSVHVVPMLDDTVGSIRDSLYILWGVVAFVLLIACANVANMLLTRAAGRQKELALRVALGAGRYRIFRQLMTESVILSLAGGFGGVVLGQWAVRLVVLAEPANLPRLDEIRIDEYVLGYTFLSSVFSGLLFGIVPAFHALHAVRTGINLTLKEGTPASASRRASLSRGFFAVAEVALALMLLIGAGLMCRSLWRLVNVDPGFDPSNIMTMRVSLARARYPDIEAQVEFYRRVLEEVQSMPDVHSAAWVSDPPISGSVGLWNNGFRVEGRPPLPPGEGIYAYLRWITPDYFRALGIPLRRGRSLEPGDVDGRPYVVVVDEAFAEKYFPGEDPIGRRLDIGVAPRVPREIIGIVGTVKPTGLELDAEPHMYVPYFQTPLSYGTLVVKSRTAAENIALAVKGRITTVDPEQAVFAMLSMDQVLANSVSDRRINAVMLASFSGLALVLALIGIYGVIAYGLAQRFKEIGVRIALGASQRDILQLALKHGLKLTIIGIAFGLAGTLMLGRLISSHLYGVKETDVPTFLAASVLFLLVAMLACYVPARRATRIDPVTVLRQE